MRTARPTLLLKSLSLCALLLVLATGCAKEEVVSPCDQVGTQKSGDNTGEGDNGSVTTSGPKATGISDDGSDQGDNEKSRKKGR